MGVGDGPSRRGARWREDHEDYPSHSLTTTPQQAICKKWLGTNLYRMWGDNRRLICGRGVGAAAAAAAAVADGNGTGTEDTASDDTLAASAVMGADSHSESARYYTRVVDLSAVPAEDLSSFLAVVEGAGSSSSSSSGGGRSSAAVDSDAVPIESSVEVYSLAHFEHVPQFKRYRNVAMGGDGALYGPIDKMGCADAFGTFLGSPTFTNTTAAFIPTVASGNVSRITSIISNRTIVRVNRFDNVNPYEAFHSYLNTYLLLKTLGYVAGDGKGEDGGEGDEHAAVRAVPSRSHSPSPHDATVAAAAAVRDIRTIQFVFVDDRGHEPNDALMWRAFSGNHYPLLYAPAKRPKYANGPVVTRRPAPPNARIGTLVFEVIDAATSSMSLLSTRNDQKQLKEREWGMGSGGSVSSSPPTLSENDESPLTGRHVDHHCKSSVARDAVRWMRGLFGVAPPSRGLLPTPSLHRDDSSPSSLSSSSPPIIRIIFSVRRPYVREGGLFHTSRELKDDEGFVGQLREVLLMGRRRAHNKPRSASVHTQGFGDNIAVDADLNTTLRSGSTTNTYGNRQYEIIPLDFAKLTPRECIRAMSGADVLVGAHGGGMLWSAFLPRHALVVEMFGGDRLPPTNRHYHNIASLFDLHHRELTLSHVEMPRSSKKALVWSLADVEKVAEYIRQTPFLTRVEP